MKWLLALLPFTAGVELCACPLCLSARPSVAKQLDQLQHAVLVVPAGAGAYRVVAVIKGSQRACASGDTTNVGPLIAANLERSGATGMPCQSWPTCGKAGTAGPST